MYPAPPPLLLLARVWVPGQGLMSEVEGLSLHDYCIWPHRLHTAQMEGLQWSSTLRPLYLPVLTQSGPSLLISPAA